MTGVRAAAPTEEGCVKLPVCLQHQLGQDFKLLRFQLARTIQLLGILGRRVGLKAQDPFSQGRILFFERRQAIHENGRMHAIHRISGGRFGGDVINRFYRLSQRRSIQQSAIPADDKAENIGQTLFSHCPSRSLALPTAPGELLHRGNQPSPRRMPPIGVCGIVQILREEVICPPIKMGDAPGP
jgi:hypothetical protein